MHQDIVISELQRLIDASPSKVVVRPRLGHANTSSETLKVAGESFLAAIADQTGGIIVADGRICLLGGDNAEGDTLASLNQLDGGYPRLFPGVLIVAYDVYGGLFGLDAEAKSPRDATVGYLPPDSYIWENLEIGHSLFVEWSMSADVAAFYAPIEKDSGFPACKAGEAISFAPPLWAAPFGPKTRMSTMPATGLLLCRAGLAASLEAMPG